MFKSIIFAIVSGVVTTLIGSYFFPNNYIYYNDYASYYATLAGYFLIGFAMVIAFNKRLGTDIRADLPAKRLRNVSLLCAFLWIIVILLLYAENIFGFGLFEKDVLWLVFMVVTLPIIILGLLLYRKKFILGPVIALISVTITYLVGWQFDFLGCGGFMCITPLDLIYALFNGELS